MVICEMEKEILICPRAGKCKATKECPLYVRNHFHIDRYKLVLLDGKTICPILYKED